MDISIVVPVYRSQECVAPLAQRVAEALLPTRMSFELVLVNDCSPDGSWQAIEEAAARHAFVKGVNLRKNVGQDNALMAGLRHAQGEVVIIMDDDLQHDPADIPRLIAKVNDGHDVCYARFSRKSQAWWKNLGSLMSGAFARVIIDKPPGLYLSPYKAIARGVVDEILGYDGPYAYVDGLILQVTSNLVEIDAAHHARFAGRGNYNLFRSVQVWLKLMTGFSVAPLRTVSVLGFVTSTLSFLVACYYVGEYLAIGTAVPGWLSLMLSVLFLGGVQLMGLGLIGEYVGRAYLKVNRKAQYSVKNVTGGQKGVTSP